MKNELKSLSDPQLRRAELLDLLSIERGLFIGWEERGLFRYTGPETHRRLYSVADYLRLGIARRAVQNGVQAAHVWSLLNGHTGAILGNVRYAVSELSGAPAPDAWELVPESLLLKVVERRMGAGGFVHSIVVVDLFVTLLDTIRQLQGYLDSEGEEIGTVDDVLTHYDLKKALEAITARIEVAIGVKC
jgi:hypothetical protein